MESEDHKILAELACSATISLAYHPDLFKKLRDAYFADASDLSKRKNVVLVVCGGVKISVDEIHEYGAEIREVVRQGKTSWEVFCNGERFDVAVRLPE